MKYKYYTIELYEYEEIGVSAYDIHTNQYYSDSASRKKSFRVFGTEEQIREHNKGLPIDEIYEYGLEEKDTYYAGISFQYSKGHKYYNPNSELPTLKEYNDKVIEFHKKMEKRYIDNNKKLLVL